MNLSIKQIKAISLLASGKLCRTVADELSVSPQTISEWKRQPVFVAEINKLRLEALEATSRKIQHSVTDAFNVLITVAQEAPNPETRRKAALDILRLGGYEPGSQQTYGWGLGPQTADGVEERWEKDEEYRQLLSRL